LRYWAMPRSRLALGARTHARELPPVPCVVRGLGGVGTHAVVHWVQRQVSAAACGWQSTNKSRVNCLADHG